MKTVQFENTGLEDIFFWSKNDLKIIRKIFELIQDIERSPFEGLGKPELLKHHLKGFWSRRITDEHRLIYKVQTPL